MQKRKNKGRAGNLGRQLKVHLQVGVQQYEIIHTLYGMRKRNRSDVERVLTGLVLLQEQRGTTELEQIIGTIVRRGYQPNKEQPLRLPKGGKEGGMIVAPPASNLRAGFLDDSVCRLEIELGGVIHKENMKERLRTLPGYTYLTENTEKVLLAATYLTTRHGTQGAELAIALARLAGYPRGMTFMVDGRSTNSSVSYLPNVIQELGKARGIAPRVEGRARIPEGLLLYVDLLGVGELIRRNDRDLLKHTNEAFGVCARSAWERALLWFPRGTTEAHQAPRGMQVFSDTAVFATECSAEGLRVLCATARFLLGDGINHKFLARGYIAKGEVDWNGGNIAGCGAIRAAYAGERAAEGIGVELGTEAAGLADYSPTNANRCQIVDPEARIESGKVEEPFEIGDWWYIRSNLPEILGGDGKRIYVAWWKNPNEIALVSRELGGWNSAEEPPKSIKTKLWQTFVRMEETARHARWREKRGLAATPLDVIIDPSMPTQNQQKGR